MTDNEALDKFERVYVRPEPGPTLVVGSKIYGHKPDRRKLYEQAVGIDMQAGEGVDVVADLEEPMSDLVGYFRHVECMSVLEHARRPWLLAANVQRMLSTGGSIFVTAPFVFRQHGYPDDYWRFTLSGLKSLFDQIDWKVALYAHVRPSKKLKTFVKNGNRYFCRTESCAFGHKI